MSDNFQKRKWSSLGALKKHITNDHKIEVAPSHSGALKGDADRETNSTSFPNHFYFDHILTLVIPGFYRNMKLLATGTDTSLNTPRKTKAIVKDRHILDIPTLKNGMVSGNVSRSIP